MNYPSTEMDLHGDRLKVYIDQWITAAFTVNMVISESKGF